MKKNNKSQSIFFFIIGALAVIIVATCMFIALAPAKRTTKAVKYDLECVAGRSKNPLQECKEKNDD